jgi:hypothetical protein
MTNCAQRSLDFVSDGVHLPARLTALYFLARARDADIGVSRSRRYERERVISIEKLNRSAGCTETEISNTWSAESR